MGVLYSRSIAVRKLAIAQGLKLNEYGVYRGDTAIAGRTEKDDVINTRSLKKLRRLLKRS